jgi:hypothetical protein
MALASKGDIVLTPKESKSTKDVIVNPDTEHHTFSNFKRGIFTGYENGKKSA